MNPKSKFATHSLYCMSLLASNFLASASSFAFDYIRMERAKRLPYQPRPTTFQSEIYRLLAAKLDARLLTTHSSFNDKDIVVSRVLICWFTENIAYPYPSQSQKLSLARAANMTIEQVTQWFAKARKMAKEIWKPIAKAKSDAKKKMKALLQQSSHDDLF